MYSPLVRYLDRRLFVRKLVHVIGGLVTAWLVLALPARWCFVLAGLVILGYWGISKRISLALFAPMLLLAVTGSKMVVAGGLVTLALGDGASAILGRLWGRTPWPWHLGKTVEGSLAFSLAAAAGLLALLWWILPNVPVGGRVILAGGAALGGSIAESLPLEIIQNGKPDDNFAVVLAGGGVLYLLCLILGVNMAGVL